jgi:prepilin-type N-terminal cleavage/methylation domain-containing protein
MTALAPRPNEPPRAALAHLGVRGPSAGFTLIELMVVVVIMGVLAALGAYGVRKYLLEGKKAEAVSMLTQIRAAEEAYRDETFEYAGLTTFDVWNPTSDPGGQKYGWEFEASNAQRTQVFNPLGVLPNGPVEYAYAVVAGPAGTDPPALPITLPAALEKSTAPFYIAMAKADLDNDGTYTYAICQSTTTAIHLEDNY